MAGIETALPHQDGNFAAAIDDLRGLLQEKFRRSERPGRRKHVTAMTGNVLAGTRRIALCPILDVFRDGQMGRGAPGEGSLDRLIHRVVHVGCPHDALGVCGHVHEQLIEVDILLMMRPNQVVEGMARNGQYRLAVKFAS